MDLGAAHADEDTKRDGCPGAWAGLALGALFVGGESPQFLEDIMVLLVQLLDQSCGVLPVQFGARGRHVRYWMGLDLAVCRLLLACCCLLVVAAACLLVRASLLLAAAC